jgi:hypothetical protein
VKNTINNSEFLKKLILDKAKRRTEKSMNTSRVRRTIKTWDDVENNFPNKASHKVINTTLTAVKGAK